MNRRKTIKSLSQHLANAINQNHNLDIIQDYIQMAVVTEMERQNQQLQIFHKLGLENGVIYGEYWGMDEICEEMPERNALTVKRKILQVIDGSRVSAYGYMWKKI